MIPFNAFKVLVSIISGSRERETNEHMAFLEFFKQLVGIVPDDMAREFGRINAPTTIKGNVDKSYQLELTVTDYLWWHGIIADDLGRFVDGPKAIQRQIWDRLTTLNRKHMLTEEQRSQLLGLVKEAEQVD